jgi:prepilin signal peptidase PulO-like enzyme (type II secretory pathway)
VYIVFVCLLIVATFTDLDHWIIPDGVTIYGTFFALAAAFLAGFYPKGFIIAGAWPFYQSAFYSPLANTLTGAVAGALLIYAIGAAGSVAFRKEAMGFGDVKLFLLLGAMLGVMNCVYVLTLASCIGSLVGGTMILLRKVSEHRASQRAISDDTGNSANMCGKENEQESSTQPQPTQEDEIFQKIVSAYQTVGAKTKSALPGVHHIPFGPYIAIAAIIVLYLGERIHNYFFGMW